MEQHNHMSEKVKKLQRPNVAAALASRSTRFMRGQRRRPRPAAALLAEAEPAAEAEEEWPHARALATCTPDEFVSGCVHGVLAGGGPGSPRDAPPEAPFERLDALVAALSSLRDQVASRERSARGRAARLAAATAAEEAAHRARRVAAPPPPPQPRPGALTRAGCAPPSLPPPGGRAPAVRLRLCAADALRFARGACGGRRPHRRPRRRPAGGG